MSTATETSRQMGIAAFQAGIKCAPWLDAKFAATVKGRKVGESIDHADAWLAGWHSENTRPGSIFEAKEDR